MGNDSLEVQVRVKNTGQIAGKEIAQLYLTDLCFMLNYGKYVNRRKFLSKFTENKFYLETCLGKIGLEQ